MRFQFGIKLKCVLIYFIFLYIEFNIHIISIIMRKLIILAILGSFLSVGCLGNTENPGKPKKSSTDKRIKKQVKHRKKHDCPHLDC